MSKKKRCGRRPTARAEPTRCGSVAWVMPDHFDDLACAGYTSLSHNPEIITAVDTVAGLIGAMTIHLMQNTDAGDVRVRNELSRKVDIEPNHYMNRSSLVRWIVRTMMLEGDGNAIVYPRTRRGYLEELIPIAPASVAFVPESGWGYKVFAGGKEYNPEDILHFALNPDPQYPWLGTGYRVPLRDVAGNLKQAAATEKGFMSSKYKPSLIVKVDSLTEEFASPAGRKKLLDSYVEAGDAGEPWLIPADQFSVQEVRPLSLADLALADFVQLDKRTVAAILGVPPFVLGVGEFQRDAWNNFVRSKVMPLAQILEQEFSRKLLYSPDWFFRFNPRSLYNYDLRDLASVADDQFVRGIMSGNEVRDWLGMPPAEGLDEMVILENYIPRGMIGAQNKLTGGGSE